MPDGTAKLHGSAEKADQKRTLRKRRGGWMQQRVETGPKMKRRNSSASP